MHVFALSLSPVEAAQCSKSRRCMGFSSQRPRWRLSLCAGIGTGEGVSLPPETPSFARRPTMTRIQPMSGGSDRPEAVEPDVEPEGQPGAPGVGPHLRTWSGLLLSATVHLTSAVYSSRPQGFTIAYLKSDRGGEYYGLLEDFCKSNNFNPVKPPARDPG